MQRSEHQAAHSRNSDLELQVIMLQYYMFLSDLGTRFVSNAGSVVPHSTYFA